MAGLHIHHSPHLAPLTETLAAFLATPLADPFTTDVVAVPTAGVRDWLQRELGRRLGVAANIDFVFPRRLTAAAFGIPLDATSPWDLDRLTWLVLDVLATGGSDVPGWLNADYPTARRIADLFDHYANNRPQLLLQWHAGHDGDGTVDERGAVVPLPVDVLWQPRLWRRLRATIGVPSQGETWPDRLADLREGRLAPTLPERVAIFGLSTLSAAQVQLFAALSDVRDVHVSLVHPSPAAWRGCRQRLAGRLEPRSLHDPVAAVQHPLLRSWARPAMDTAALVNGLESDLPAGVEIVAHDQPAGAPSTLLQQIQADLAADTEPVAHRSQPTRDSSLQVHGCHGATRQLEVLRDALGHLFAADQSLAAHEVTILCPDLQRFAPLIASVFQRSSLPVPVRVTDLSLGSGNPVAAAVDAVLATASGRCTGPDILGLIALAPVRQRFGFSDDDLELVARWIDSVGTTWGIDGDHRGQWVPHTIVDGTWAASLDRLLLGAAMPAPEPRVGPGDVAPYDDIDANSFITSGRLACLIAEIDRVRRAVEDSHPIEDWIAIVTAVVHAFCAIPVTEVWQITAMLQAIDTIGAQAVVNDQPSSAALTLIDVRALLNSVIAGARGRLHLRSGAVTATAPVPVRNIPSRVICILGLDDQSMRGTRLDGDDILGLRSCVGERDPRLEGRHLLLEAIMAAGDHLLITYDSSDITTNRPLPAPVALAELLQVVRATRPEADIVVQHPRQAFDRINFLPGAVTALSGDQPFSFDAAMLAAARRRRTTVSRHRQHLLLTPADVDAVTVTQLINACTRPTRTFLQQRLDLRLPRPATELDTDIPLGVDALRQWNLADQLIDMARRGVGGDREAWISAQRRGGLLPPRELATAVLDEVVEAVDSLLAAEAGLVDLLARSGPVDIDLAVPLGDGRTITIRDTIDGVAGDRLVRVSFSREGPRFRLASALQLAALVAAFPDRGYNALVVMRAAGQGKSTSVRHISPPADTAYDSATALLTVASAIFDRAMREPLPMFARCSYDLFTTGNIDDDDFTRELTDDDDARFVWGEHTVDDLLAIPLAVDELDAVRAGAAGDARAVAFARLLWTAFAHFADPSELSSA